MPIMRDITEVEQSIRPFPDGADVFSQDVDAHLRHLLPLVNVDASIAYPDLKIWLPIICPIEPLLELDIGYFTAAHHDEYNINGQIAFRVKNGKYQFTGNFHYFAYESGKIFEAFPDQHNEIEEDRCVRIKSYNIARDRYREFGHLYPRNVDPTEPSSADKRYPFVKQLGGRPEIGNWSALPTNKDGQPFRYIATAMGFLYAEGAIQFIDLFYDPKEEVALFRFDYT